MPELANSNVGLIERELDRWSHERRRKYSRFTLSVLSSLPWEGGFLSASSNFQAESDQSRVSELQRQWLKEHESKLETLAHDIAEIVTRFEQIGAAADERLSDPNYRVLVEQAFRVWDKAATAEKRAIIKRILPNATATSLCPDDLVRLFIEWTDRYHEAHFAVIREIYKETGINRAEIWQRIYGQQVREDSAEADLYKLLIRDLSSGGVIRQHRDRTTDGEFLRHPRSPARRPSSIVKSAFSSDEPYELTELGKQFVHYALSDIVPRLGETQGS